MSDEAPASPLSNPFYSTHTSVSSVTGRRGSSASVLSERRTSYQYGRRCSDVSVAPGNGNNIHNTKRVQFRSPIHEQYNVNRQLVDVNQSRKLTEIEPSEKELKISSVLCVKELTEEPNSQNMFHYQYQCTKV